MCDNEGSTSHGVIFSYVKGTESGICTIDELLSFKHFYNLLLQRDGTFLLIVSILNNLKIESGSIKLFGKELTDDAIKIKEQIGVVYDASNFSGWLTPDKISNVMRAIYKQWDDTVYSKYLKVFKLPPNQKVSTFSKGMTMKLALSVAISHSPKLLILDEVTSGLDPVVREDILDVFLDFVQDEEHSIFLSSHITSDLEKVADYITFIDNGKVLLTAKKDDLIDNYGIIRCKASLFNSISKDDFVAFRKKDYQIDVLVTNIIEMRKYISYILWVLVATVIAVIFTHMLVAVKGHQYFDFGMRDILTIFFVSVAFPLSICSFFYLGLYLIGYQKCDILIMISAILSVCFTAIMIVILNSADITIETGRIIILGVSVVFLLLSYNITKSLYRKSEV
jgi:ABC-2 type transport system ATP-binding protein